MAAWAAAGIAAGVAAGLAAALSASFATAQRAAPAPGVATEATKRANEAAGARPGADRAAARERAMRGKIAEIDTDAIRAADGSVVWPIRRFDFLKGGAPDTVNPLLWAQSALIAEHGLFEVADGVWQVRGYDLSAMTLIAGETGWIVVDPLTTVETAAAALKLANDTLGARPVAAVIYSHSHADHFGGARGVLPQGAEDSDGVENADAAAIPIIAPHEFMTHAVAENLLAGNHMRRRATLMFGAVLPASPTGHVSAGLGPALPQGTLSLAPPTEELPKEGAERVIDGVTFEFMDAGGTEAPSALLYFIPEKEVLGVGDLVVASFHNLLTPRGAKARDGLAWSRVIDDALVRFGGRAEVMAPSHTWPIWGRDAVAERLRAHRDIYRFVHDQTLRLANAGAVMDEAAEALETPAFAREDPGVWGFYGTLNHNAKAVYQFYFGWWGGVPAEYFARPSEETAARYVAAMGGAPAVIALGAEAFDEGDYRWAAELLNKVVFAEPENADGRAWLAAAYEQIGFQAESGPWRSYFLGAAAELRRGPPKAPAPEAGTTDFLAPVASLDLLDALAARYDPARLSRPPFSLNFVFPDRGEALSVEVSAATLTPRSAPAAEPAATLTLDRALFDRVLLRQANLAGAFLTGEAAVDGDAAAVLAFFGLLEQPPFWFNTAAP